MSFATERQVHMAAQLYRYRDLARALLGPKFEPTMRDLAGVLQRLAVKLDTNVLGAAIRTAKTAEPMDQVLILAAAVEDAEPSIATLKGR